MKKKTHSLTVLLLKDGSESPVVALKGPDALTKVDLEVGGEAAILFYKKTSNPPAWAKLFRTAVGDALDDLFNAGSAAVLLVPSAGRTFAITFGYGRTLLNSDCYEENFGLYVVLNSVNPAKLRSVDVQSLDAVPVQTRSQASVATEFADFGLDIEQDLMCAATGTPLDAAFGKQITGKDAVKVTLPLDLNDIPALLIKLFVQSSAATYKKSFSWIDHLSQVRDPGLSARLNERLEEKILAKDFQRTWLSIPDIIEWADVDGFKYQKRKSEAHADIDWESYLASLDEDVPCSVETFKKQQVLCIKESDGQTSHFWPVYRCIYCELELDGRTYALTNGKWYRVDVDFLADLNKTIDEIPLSTIDLPDYEDTDEGAYNKRASKGSAAYFALMDKKTITYGGGNSSIEFCDLFSVEKHLVHVKRYGGSSVLSHLFAQGLVSARLLLSDGAFREKVNAELPETHKIEGFGVKPVPNAYEVVYAIVSNNPAKFQLPLFSKINLRNCYKQLRMFDMRVSLKVILAQPEAVVPV